MDGHMNQLLDKIAAAIGRTHILEGADVSERYAVDWSRENPCKPAVVLRPTSTQQVSAILRLCNEARQPLVTQGGMTGLAGGATPQTGEWVLSLEKMNGIVELDADSMTLTARAGTPLETLQNAAREAGLMLPLDLGARGSCTIGGNIATNAGGNQVIQYGMTRSLVLGLEAVMADGTIISSRNKLLKNNTGFDLKHLFIGSEGSLGIVTEAILRLFPATSSRQSALCAMDNFSDVVALLKVMKRKLPVISAFEAMWASYFRHAVDVIKCRRDPFEHPYNYYVLLESEGNDPDMDEERFQSALFEELESGRIADAVISRSGQDRQDFWAIRDSVGEILRSLRHEANFDIGIPLSETEDCIREIDTELNQVFPGLFLLIFGHVGDGNLHLIATTGKPEDTRTIYDIVYRITGAHQGGIAAEHGIGMLKKPWLHLSRSQDEIALMRTLKAAFDPNNILNPGRVI
jgi:FAD/FMN-containing dehydrogenase